MKIMGDFTWQLMFCCISDGLHLTAEGNTVVYREVIKVFDEAGLSADNLPFDFPHHSKIDSKHPERAFQQNACDVQLWYSGLVLHCCTLFYLVIYDFFPEIYLSIML